MDYNNIYVLNMNLGTVGKLEKLAEGERIFSARFAGDRAYLVTYEQVDPFFVIDLKNPSSPKVAGELKIPGFSTYLHPYGENYVIGLGQEDGAVKLSLFDVTDLNNPKEISKYLINKKGATTESIALHEPKAFLFDPQKQLLVIPITINYYQWWSGVYVFKVSPENGFTLQNELCHASGFTLQNELYNASFNNQWNSYATRSLYIDNTLYTISNDKIQLCSIDDFRVIAKVTF